LDGLAATDDDVDAGARIHRRAARMAVLNVPVLRELAPDLVVSDVITAGGGMAAELLGIPWIELNPHPLYLPSKGLPPIGSGLAPGTGIRGRLRDATMRALTARSLQAGNRQRAEVRAKIGLPATDPGPLRRLIATLPALEVPRPDWPGGAGGVGPPHLQPTSPGPGGPRRPRPPAQGGWRTLRWRGGSGGIRCGRGHGWWSRGGGGRSCGSRRG